MNKNDLGFAHLFLIVVALVLAIGGLIYYSWQKGLIKTTPNQEPSPTPTSAEIEKFETQEDCESKLEHKCIYYLCDIPLGEVYQRLCNQGQGSGWYSSKEIAAIEESNNVNAPTINTPSWEVYRNEEYGFEITYYSESGPNEQVGNEEAGQFTYLLSINFGNVPLHSQHGYNLQVNKKDSIEDYRSELVGHITDKIESEETSLMNGITWTKLNYRIFLTSDYVSLTTAFVNHDKYGYAITSPASEIDQILSTFKFTN
ncbi:MAG: hypothetical protein UT08_C0018G0029 [Candidatus Woesebacteria bacterium GW2011_GWB1_38_8]|uniref:Uncharacterized protein n=1 Tax=Candidatus Woesebacteria bacterium GW2011_GWB1_38_8 TaxID=1618570 RepID=A0A0G0KXR5_9BACT|nr:MAG: hypothetical protein UT08_C0018G0029 [Candidatus Woesebacteria bacterium GW2011_GWB1_38_8]